MSALIARRPGRKRKREDEDVIKTEPDKRRATGAAGENDFEDEEDAIKAPPVYNWTNTHEVLNRKHVLRKIRGQEGGKESKYFPFLNLPAEVRNMIYRYLVLSRAQNEWFPAKPTNVTSPIYIGLPRGYTRYTKHWTRGGIETSVLSVNRQIHFESSMILYTENKCAVNISGFGTFINYRVDVPSTVTMPTRSLRSGRVVDMMKYTGLVYPHMVARLRILEVDVTIPNNISDNYYYYCSYDSPIEYKVHVQLEKLADLLVARAEQEGFEGGLSAHGKKWVIKFGCGDRIGLIALKIMLYPFLKPEVMRILRDGQVAVHIEGKMPEGWETVMQELVDNGATVGMIREFPNDHRDLWNAYKLLSYFWAKKGKYLPASIIRDEEMRRGIRHCIHCRSYHVRDESDEGSDATEYDDDLDDDLNHTSRFPYDFFTEFAAWM